MKKLIAFALIICMLAVALASCGGGKDSVTTKAPNGTGTSGNDAADDKWADVNFGDETIIISLSDHEPSFMTSAGATNSVKYIKGPDNYTTDPVQNAVYDRNRDVSAKLGLDIQYQICDQYNSSAPNQILPIIEGFVLADLEDSPDIISTMNYGMIRAGIKGHLYNALATEEENYFDFSHDGWYTDIMYENTLDESKIYMLASDYFIDTLRYAYGMFVNLDMYDEVFASEGGSDSLFELINAGDWTYDELARCIGMSYVDSGTIGAFDDEDIYGAVNNRHWMVRCAFSTSGLDIFEKGEDGKIKYTEDITEVHNFVDDMIQLTKTNGFYLNMNGCGNPYYDYTTVFGNGKAMFSFDVPVLQLEGTLIQNMDDKVGLIPYPKYNKDLEYGALVSDCSNSGAILYNSDKFTESSAFLQMSTEKSNGADGTLVYEYYDIALMYKLSDTPQQIDMLEYIRNGLCSPRSMLYDNYFAQNVALSAYFTLINNSLAKGTNTFASDWNSQFGAVQQSLESTLATYGVQE